ncbi:MAG TPA: hypothetical protein VE733_19695 [Streptosporangiaceae bacterium]|nr:hypothetical protein [Streptosporangiaceae bacterium]
MLVMVIAAAVLAKATAPANDVTPGVLGFLVVAGMGLALFFLLKSMNRQFKKLPPPPAETDASGQVGRKAGQPSPGPSRRS